MKRALVTRPAGEAQRWVSALQHQGWQAQALPLIEIAPAADLQPLRQARAHLNDYRRPDVRQRTGGRAVLCRPDRAAQRRR